MAVSRRSAGPRDGASLRSAAARVLVAALAALMMSVPSGNEGAAGADGGARGAAAQVVIRVAPDGKDVRLDPQAPLTAEIGPVPSLNRAAALVRDIRARGADVDIAIEVAPGIHRLDRPVMLAKEHSGCPGRPLVIRGAPDGSTRIVGSVELHPRAATESDRSLVERLPASAKAHVRFYTLPDEAAQAQRIDVPRAERLSTSTVPFEIFDAHGALYPARWPNEDWAPLTGSDDRAEPVLQLAAPQLALWRGEPDLWVGGTFWSYESRLVRDVDPATHSLTLSTALPMGIAPDAGLRVYHALAELDEPGEWYRAADRRTLVAWPRDDDGVLEVSVAPSLMILNGANDVVITGLTFERSRGNALVVRDGTNVVISNSTIRWTGGRGAVFLGGADSGVEQSTVADTGDGGILISGGDRSTLAPGRLFVRNTALRRYQRLTMAYRAAVHLAGVGNTARGNFISEAPHYGIYFEGNDHLIEFNELTRVVSNTNDMGAIYTGADWSSRGNVIRSNYLHDIIPRPGADVKGVYLDDGTSGATVVNNLFLRVPQPVFLGGGRDNVVEGNVFLASEPGVHLDGRGLTWARHVIVNPQDEVWVRLRAMPYRSDIWRARYPTLADLDTDDPGVPKRNVIRDNVFAAGEPFEFLPEVDLKAQSIGPNLVVPEDSDRERGPLWQAIEGAKNASDLTRLASRELKSATFDAIPLSALDEISRHAGRSNH